MDFQFKVTGENSGCDSSNDENEYHMEIQFTSLNFDDKAIENIQVILLNGDLMNKIDVHRQDVKLFDEIDEDHQDNEFRIENIYYIIHSTPTRFAEKLLDVPIIVLFLTDDQQIIGNPILIEVNECFANSVRCNDFKAESLRKTYDIADETKNFGKVSLNFSITKDIGNSNRFRRFYTESTAERLKLEAILNESNK